MSETLPLGLQYKWVAKAACAPSAYNTQPVRWHFGKDGSIILFEDRRRLFPIADPDEWQHRTAIGAAFEGLRLAASEDGYQLLPPSFDVMSLPIDWPSSNDLLPLAITSLRKLDSHSDAMTYGASSQASRKDPLSQYVRRRHAYTGAFKPLTTRLNDQLVQWVSCQPSLTAVSELSDKEAIAHQQDECTLELLNNPLYYQELHEWRLKTQNYFQKRSRFNKEVKSTGLDSPILSAVPMQKKMHNFSTFRLLNRIGLGKWFLSDYPATLSASHIILLSVDRQLSDFYIGRLTYRIWLEMTAMGIAVCPMQTLMESSKGRHFLNNQYASADQAIVMAFRVGQAIESKQQLYSKLSLCPRRPTKELLINPEWNPKNA